MANGYRSVLSVAGAQRLLWTSVLARMPLGMSALAILLLVRHHTGSFGSAGVTVGAFAISQAAASPVLGALVDRFGQRRVLLPCAAAQSALLVLLVVAVASGAPVAALAALAAVAGAPLPPVAACLRALWPSVVPDPAQREAAYSLDAVSQETIWTLGPLLVGAAIAAVSPAAAVIVCAAFTLGGTVAFATSPLARARREAPVGRGRGGPLASAGIRLLLASAVFMGLCIGAVEVGLPSLAFDLGSGATAGMMLSVWSMGSAAGGLWYGARRWTSAPHARYPWVLVVMAVSTAPLLAAHSVPAAVVLSVVAGVAYAPTMSCQIALVNTLAPVGTVTEAFTWINAALGAGIALGTALAGGVVGAGVAAPFALGCAAAGVGAAIAARGRRQMAGVRALAA
jgi:MFS family permease